MVAKQLNNEKGFSLIEVIVAMVLIGIISAAFTSVVFTGSKASTSHKLELESLMIAQDIIEEMRLKRDDGIDLLDWRATKFTLDAGIWKTSITKDGYTYEVSAHIDDVSSSGADLMQVVIEVMYEGGANPVYLATRVRV
jgi:prepilin-type N-terminal cleavage/methylation domain-containing protein